MNMRKGDNEPFLERNGCLLLVVLFVVLGVMGIWALSPRKRKLEKWFKQEEPALASLPNPPFGDARMQLNGKCLMIAQDSEVLKSEDVHDGTIVSIPGEDHMCYPASWGQNTDLDSVDYVIFLRPGKKEFHASPAVEITYSVNPITGQRTEMGRRKVELGGAVVDDEYVYIIRRDDHECILARHIKAGSLRKLLAELGLSNNQCSAATYLREGKAKQRPK
jgi:hypothetical protein